MRGRAWFEIWKQALTEVYTKFKYGGPSPGVAARRQGHVGRVLAIESIDMVSFQEAVYMEGGRFNFTLGLHSENFGRCVVREGIKNGG